MEVERKWLINLEYIPSELEIVDFYTCERSYMVTDPCEVRLSKISRSTTKNPCYMLTTKSEGGMDRVEIESYITSDEYYRFMKDANISSDTIIRKTCNIYTLNKYNLIVNVVDKNSKTEFSYGEIEFESLSEAMKFDPPEWFGKEVTNDSYYKMKNYWSRITNKRKCI